MSQCQWLMQECQFKFGSSNRIRKAARRGLSASVLALHVEIPRQCLVFLGPGVAVIWGMNSRWKSFLLSPSPFQLPFSLLSLLTNKQISKKRLCNLKPVLLFFRFKILGIYLKELSRERER